MIMEELKSYQDRMKEILNASWKVFKWQFVNKAFVRDIGSEASFQFHFASIIKSIGDMYVSPEEMFYVDIETKFKRKRDSKGTFSEGRIFRMYRDIDYLERETGVKGNDEDSCYSEGRFYFITDNSSYMSKDEAFKQGGTTYTHPLIYKNESIHLNKAYPIEWDERESIGKSSSDKWYFLEIAVAK